MSRLVLSLLGSFQAVLDGAPVTTFESDKVRALLAYLAVEHARPQRREMLAGLLWPDMPERDARTNLRHVLMNLRKALGDHDADQPFLLASRQTLQFNVEADYRLDVQAFTGAIAATTAHTHTGLDDCETCIARLREAAGLYNGDFLAGFSLDSDLFEAWITTWREKLHIQVLDVLEHLATYHEQRGDYAEVISYAQRQVDLEPWRESAHRQWMRALACSGQRGMAIAQYETCRRILETELGIESEVATTALYEVIRRGDLQPHPQPLPTLQSIPRAMPTLPHPSAPTLSISHTTILSLEGEHRVVTLLLADLRGTVALAQSDAEAWAELITPALHLLGAEITRLGGNVAQYRRDGLTACFGGQVAHEDDPERAVLAALAMREALIAYLAEREVGDLSLTVSVHTGEVICMPIGETTSMLGAVVESAEAIQTNLAPGTIWASEATHRLVASLFTWASLDENGYEPSAHRPQVDKGRGIFGLSSPLVGRDVELRTLQEAVEHLHSGIGWVVTVVGEAGIGKSRLVAELKRSASAGLSWIEGRCFSYAANSAYQVWRDMLHAWLDAPANAPSEAVVTTLRERVRAVCLDAFDDVYPFLAWLLSLPLDEVATARLRGIDAEGLQVLTFRAVETLLETAARRTPLALVCEDLHWADATSLALLEHLLALTDRAPLLFVCIFRPEREYGCWYIRELAARVYEHRHTDIQLNALSLAESAQLVSNLLTIEALPQAFRTRVLARAEGNPFYVEEIIRSLIDDAIIVYDEIAGRWHAVREMDERALPDTLYGVLMARIDRLPVGAKRVLQLAAVIGHIFSYPLLDAIAERSTLDANLVTLQRAQMIRERARLPERDYIFHHQFTLEAAYDGLLRRARRVLHRRVAEALETLYPQRIEENLGLLAHHWERAGEIERAIPCLLRAGEKAAIQYANEEACNYYQHATEMLEDLEPNNTCQNWRLTALRSLGKLCFTEGKVPEAENYIREAITLGRTIQIDLQELLLLYYWLGEALWWQSRYEEQLRVGEDGLALLGGDKKSLAAALMNQIVATSMWMLGSPEQGMEITQRTAQFIQHIPYVEELCVVYESIIQARIIHKDVTGAYEWLQVFEENVTTHHDLLGLVVAYRYIGDVLQRTGDLASAIQQCSKRLDLCVLIGDCKHESRALSELAQLSLRLGEIRKAVDYVNLALPICLSVGYARDIATYYDLVGGIAMCQNEYAKAIIAFKQALLLYQDAKSLYGPVQMHYRLGRAYLTCKNHAKALQSFQDSFTALAKIESAILLQPAVRFFPLLSGLEEACADFSVFQALCQRIRTENRRFEEFLTQWHLEAATIKRMPGSFTEDKYKTLEGDWTWCDPFGDCSYVVRDALTIYAVNGRDLWDINKSAPRLMRDLSIGVSDFIVQVMSAQVSDDYPAVGGLLLWSNDQNYLWLQRGRYGRHDIVFGGCLNNKDVIVGRGRLPLGESSERAFLRMEYTTGKLNALCSIDNEQWFSVGGMTFLMADMTQVGVYAIGNIDRIVYHGAYPDGAAIRFSSFQLWESKEN